MTKRADSVPTVTIGLPFSDQPVHMLAAAIRSVFAQTDPRWSLILVGDGAPRQNRELVRSISDPRVHVEEFVERGGLARRLNDIAAMTETPYLFRMDADDVMHPERVARQLEVLDSGTADMVGTRAYLIDGSDRIYGLMKEPPTAPRTPRELLGRGIFTHPTIAARTEWFRAHPYDESLLRGEDKALYICAASSRMVKMPDLMLFWRVLRPVSPSKQARDSQFDRIVVRKYGHLVASRPTVLAYVAKSQIRQWLFKAISTLQGRDYLFERKIDSLDVGAIEHGEHALRTALTCFVPGWPPDVGSGSHRVDMVTD